MSATGPKNEPENRKGVGPSKNPSWFRKLFNKVLQAIHDAFLGLWNYGFGKKPPPETVTPEPNKLQDNTVSEQPSPETVVSEPNELQDNTVSEQPPPETVASEPNELQSEEQEPNKKNSTIKKYESMIAEINTLVEDKNVSDDLKGKLRKNIQGIKIHLIRLKGYKPNDLSGDNLPGLDKLEDPFKPYLTQVENNIREAYQQIKATENSNDKPTNFRLQ